MKRLGFMLVGLFAVGSILQASEYSKLLKSPDPQLKYQSALMYFAQKDYKKTITLLEDVSDSFRGTEEAENLLYVLATSYFMRKDYISASHYYNTYTSTFLRGSHLEECQFQEAVCHYKESPHPELDQSETRKAINSFELFLRLYPMDERVPEAQRMLAEMYDKLAKRELINATLYCNLGNYKGNNYRSAIVVAHNAMNDYPDSPYVEDLAFIIVRAKYREAINSVQKVILQRSEDAYDECYYFMQEYPNSRHQKEVEHIAKQLEKIVLSPHHTTINPE